MKVYRRRREMPVIKEKVILAFGKFDGLHVGHQKLVDRVIKDAKQENAFAGIFTFSNHPSELFKPKLTNQRLISNYEKIKLLEKKGIDLVILIDFSRKFANINAKDFLNLLQSKLLSLKIVVGKDFKLGKDRETDIEGLKELGKEKGFEVDVVSVMMTHKEKVSSTLIRTLIEKGNIKEANSLFGRPYSIEGIVIKRDARGREIGFPTANVKNKYFVNPKEGVYLTGTQISRDTSEIPDVPDFEDETYYGMTYVGKTNLSFDKEPSIETHLFNCNRDLYDKTIRVIFYKRIRDAQTFDDYEQLKTQLENDKKQCLEILKTEEVNVFN